MQGLSTQRRVGGGLLSVMTKCHFGLARLERAQWRVRCEDSLALLHFDVLSLNLATAGHSGWFPLFLHFCFTKVTCALVMIRVLPVPTKHGSSASEHLYYFFSFCRSRRCTLPQIAWAVASCADIQEWKLYDYVARHFIASLMDDFSYTEHRL